MTRRQAGSEPQRRLVSSTFSARQGLRAGGQHATSRCCTPHIAHEPARESRDISSSVIVQQWAPCRCLCCGNYMLADSRRGPPRQRGFLRGPAADAGRRLIAADLCFSCRSLCDRYLDRMICTIPDRFLTAGQRCSSSDSGGSGGGSSGGSSSDGADPAPAASQPDRAAIGGT